MIKKAIIHISDLHICDQFDIKGRPNEAAKNFILTTSDSESSVVYIDKFCEKVNINYADGYELTLLITGDITNASSVEENEKAADLILRIVEKLKIRKNDVFLLPGDHDINRDLCKFAFSAAKAAGDKRQSYEFDEKYNNFCKLYLRVTGREFDSNKVVVNYKKFAQENLYLVGLNTNSKIDFEGGSGFINYDKLVNEIEQLMIPKDSSVIVAFHHNIFSSYESDQVKSWEKDNRRFILDHLKSINVKCIFHGNEHTRGSRVDGSLSEELVISSDVGCFASNDPKPSFKIYDVVSDAKGLRLKNNIYKYIDENSINTTGKWSLQTSTEVGESVFFDLRIRSEVALNSTEIPVQSQLESLESSIQKDYKIKSGRSYREDLFRIVKDKKLFHSGHFHWSETSRAHNWIDVTRILNEYNDLTLAKDAIVDLIEQKIIGIGNDFDLIIGLGIEGNILSTKVSIKYGKPYSFLPYSYRYDDHNHFEQDLCFRNNGDVKSVLIISDVVNDGRTIRKLIKKREREFFESVEKIYVVSLFYTGDELRQDSSILNLSEEKIIQKRILGDHPEDRISYFYILNLKVERCPYGENYRNDCIVIKENLGCVHKFYNEEKAKRKRIKRQGES